MVVGGYNKHVGGHRCDGTVMLEVMVKVGIYVINYEKKYGVGEWLRSATIR